LKPFLLALLQKAVSGHLRPFILLITTMLLLAFGAEPPLQFYSGYFLLISGMILVGIPHGAVDHLLEIGIWNKPKAANFIIYYLLQAAFMGVVWYLVPDAALLIFLGYSAWHFGQADGQLWGFSSGNSILWGSSVLIFILGTHSAETNDILKFLGSIQVPFQLPATALLPWLAYAIVRANLSLAITIIWLSLSSQLPLIFAFGLFFIGQHSCTSWQQICRHLKLSHKTVWLHAMPFHLAAWLLMAGFFLLWPDKGAQSISNRWAIFFIFIACISLPHAISMKKIYPVKN
jgi:Brp/Blh family beta-carotene 15,15'-monooxygenase